MGRRAYLSRYAPDRVIALTIVVVAFAAQWYRHATFRTATFDLPVFEQVVWKMAHGHGATSSLTAWNTFGDHFSPLLLVFVPLYRLAATPLWFFGAQALAAGLSVLCVRPLVRAAGGDERSGFATVLVIAFALNPALWNAVVFDFHTTTLAVPVLMIGCMIALQSRHRAMWVVLLILFMLRDDLALAGVALGFVGWKADTQAGHRMRVAFVTASVALLVLGAQIGTALGASRHFVARYGYVGTSMTDAATHPLHALVGVMQHLVAVDNIYPAIALLVPLAFLPLRKPGWLALAGVMALPTLLARDPNLHSSAFQYGAPIVPFLFLAAAGAPWSLTTDWRRRATFLLVPLALVGFVGIGPPGTGTLTAATANAADARAAIATIRPDDVVVASGSMTSHVADRVTVIPFPYPYFEGKHSFPLDPRVTSRSQTRRDSVDAIIIAATDTDKALLDRLLRDPEIVGHFTARHFGQVVVLRRDTDATGQVSK